MQIKQFIRDIPYYAYRMRRRAATGAVMLAAFVLLVHVVFGQNGLAVYLKKRDENVKLQQEIKNLQDDNARLQQKNEALASDPKAIEKEAREQLKYARPGEVVYTLPQDKNKKTVMQAAQSPATAKSASPSKTEKKP